MMRKRTYLLLIPFFILTACSFSVSTANISSAVLANNESGSPTTTLFQPSETVYGVLDLANAPDETAVRAVWTAVNVGDVAAPNTVIEETTLETGSGTVTFSLAPNNPFPAGAYKVDIYLNDELVETLDFQVQGELAAAPVAEPAAEGDKGGSGAGEVAEPAPTAAPIVEASAPSSGAIGTLEDVRQATVRIRAQGTFVDPEIGQVLNAAGQGTGFIIDQAGIAVTNNHVVTGAAFIEVYIEGEEQPRNARVLGVSECSDLAVIDIDGEGFPYLEWYNGNISVGLDIYAAGFPLFENEEYTLTRGIISKAQANGETNWASVNNVLEIDATINGGNSGGPLVTSNGQVVGVNYAGNSSTSQYFSISVNDARPIVEQLRNEQDVHSIGINGRAVSDGQSIFGVWVSSVESGTPADRAGIRPGDIVTKLEGLVLGVDGTLSAYCDILRSRRPTDTMSVEVLRFATGEVLTGQLNGERELETAVLFDIGGDEMATGEGYSQYVTISDSSGRLVVEVPSAWSDTTGDAWVSDGETLGLSVAASPSLSGYYDTWGTPGVFLGASDTLASRFTVNDMLDQSDFSGSCDYDGRQSYSDSAYTGAYDVWTNCGGQGTVFVSLAAMPPSGGTMLFVQVQLVTDADLEALERIFDSFFLN